MNIRNFTISGFVSSEPKYVKKNNIRIFGFIVSHEDMNEGGKSTWFNFPVRAFENMADELNENIQKGTVLTVTGKIQSSDQNKIFLNIDSVHIFKNRKKLKLKDEEAREIADWVEEFEKSPSA